LNPLAAGNNLDRIIGPVDSEGNGGMYDADPFSVASSDLGRPSVTVCVSGEVDMLTAPKLLECLLAAIEDKPRELVIDMTEVAFMDSSGISALIQARNRLPKTSDIVLRGVHSNIRSVLEITTVDSLFRMED
jgi:anti-sigma B factor antagonist